MSKSMGELVMLSLPSSPPSKLKHLIKKKVNGNKVLVLVAQGESHSTLFLGSLPFKFLTVKKKGNISDTNQSLHANRPNSNLDYRNNNQTGVQREWEGGFAKM